MGHLLTVLNNKNPIVQDGFNRVDSATTMGNANTGQTWTVDTTAWGITNNTAYSVSTITTNYVVLPAISDAIVSLKVTYSVNEGLLFRYTDSSNHLFCRLSSASLILAKVVAGVQTTIGTYSVIPVVGSVYALKVVCSGSSVRVFMDGVERITVTETANQTATKAGLRAANSTAGRFDIFEVKSL